jgi:arabinofuranosyltransferase
MATKTLPQKALLYDPYSNRRTAKSSPAWVFFCLLLALVPTLVKLLYYPHNIGSDDAYIHLEVARNVVSGHGWGLNAGAPVNLSSSPAFTLLLVTISKMTSHVIGATQILSCAASCLGLLLIFWTVRSETGSTSAGLVAEASAALSCDLWRWNGTVMEASAAFFAVALLLFLFRRQMLTLWQSFLFGLVAGVAVLLRPELLVAAGLCACGAAAQHWQEQRMRGVIHALAIMGGTGLCLAPWLVFARLTFGSYLPTTFHAKSSPGFFLWNSTIAKQMLELTGESFCGLRSYLRGSRVC